MKATARRCRSWSRLSMSSGRCIVLRDVKKQKRIMLGVMHKHTLS